MSIQRKPTSLPWHPPFFYGWVIVGIASLSMFFSGPGQTFTISVFIDSYIRDFGWSRTTVSTIYSIATLGAGLMLFVVGRLADRFGLRAMMVTISLLLGFACLWNSFVVNLLMLFFGFFMIRLFGQGSMTLLPQTLVPQWFVKKRGRAFSFTTIGIAISSAVLPPVNAWLIETWGWSLAWQVWFVLLVVFFAPVALLFVRNRPEDVGLLPDNAGSDNDGGDKRTAKKRASENVAEEDWTLKEAQKTRAFWLMLFCIGIPAMVNTGIIFHLVSIMQENGIEKTTTAIVLSMIAVAAFPFTFLAGFVVERIKIHLVFACVFVGQCLVMLLLLFSQNLYMAFLFGIVRGVVQGFETICIGIVWPNYFGRKYLGSIKGLVQTTVVVSSALGPIPFGLAYDWLGGYFEIILLSMLFPALGALAAYLSPKPDKSRVVSSKE